MKILAELSKGHNGSIISLDYCLRTNTILTGSEDCTARLWDASPVFSAQTKSSPNLSRCRSIKMIGTKDLYGHKPVTHVKMVDSTLVFGSLNPVESSQRFGETGTEQRGLCAFISAGTAVYCFNLSGPEIVIAEPFKLYELDELDKERTTTEVNEINSFDIIISARLLLVCDDCMEIHAFDIDTGEPVLYFSGFHENICTSVVAPSPMASKDLQSLFFSGGFDCRLNCFSVQGNQGALVQRVDIGIHQDESTPSTPILNPPFVNFLLVTEDGNYLFVALGDGTINVFHTKTLDTSDGLESINRFLAHSAGVCGLAACLKSNTKTLFSADRNKQQRYLLASIGNDRMLKLWELEMQPSTCAKNGLFKLTKRMISEVALQDKPNRVVWLHEPLESKEPAKSCTDSQQARVAIAGTSDKVKVFGLQVPSS